MIEIPPRFQGRQPASFSKKGKEKENKKGLGLQRDWPSASGLAEDVLFYGDWIRGRAAKQIGHLYQQIEITHGSDSRERARLKAAFRPKIDCHGLAMGTDCEKSKSGIFSDVDVPLATTFILSSKPGITNVSLYVKPIIEGKKIPFHVIKLKMPLA